MTSEQNGRSRFFFTVVLMMTEYIRSHDDKKEFDID